MKQSCILNFNENFGNNTASDFDVNFNRELALEAKSEVALYNLQMARKPIVVTQDQELTLELVSSLPSELQRVYYENTRGAAASKTGGRLLQANNIISELSNASITCVIEKGEYTKQEFLQYCADTLNAELIDYNTASAPYNQQGSFNFNNKYGAANTQSRNELAYKFQYKEDDNGLFWGLVRDHEPEIMAIDFPFGATSAYAGNIQAEAPIVGMKLKMFVDNQQDDGSGALSATYTGNISVAPAAAGRGAGDTTLGTLVRGRDALAPSFYNRWDEKDPTLTGQKMCSFEYDWEISAEANKTKVCNQVWWNTASSQRFNGTTAGANALPVGANINPLVKTLLGPGAHIVGNGTGQVDTEEANLNISSPTPGALGQVPLSFLGIRRAVVVGANSVIQENSIVLYQNENLQRCCDGVLDYSTGTGYPYELSLSMEELATFNLRSSLNPNGKNYQKFRWNFYAMDTEPEGLELGKPSVALTNNKVYYYQLLAFNTEGGGDWDMLYDSQHTGKHIPKELIDDGEAFFNAVNVKNRDVDPDAADGHVAQSAQLGFQPLFTFQGCSETDSLINPMGTFLNTYTGDGAAGTARPIIRRSIAQYALSGTGELTRIFGIPRTSNSRRGLGTSITALKNSLENLTGRALKNPNFYPQHVGNYSGWRRLFGDGIRYNIEIQSLPIKCLNTRKTDKSIAGGTQLNSFTTFVAPGSVRPVIYNVGGFQHDLSDNNESYTYIDLEPNNLKYLTLDNPEKIKLNNLRVQVRRAATNEIASEIEDCALEILIQN